MSYEQLIEKFAAEYEDSLLLQYKDEDGDLITVRSQSDLDIMIADQPESMKVYLNRNFNSGLVNVIFE